MMKLDAKTLPLDVVEAHAAAERWIAEQFRGRRIVPRPTLVKIPVPEEGDAAALYAIIVPPGGDARQRLDRAVMASALARDRGGEAMMKALETADEMAVVECCLWVQGMPQDTAKDPRVLAREHLKALREEAGSLGAAYGLVAQAIAKLLQAPEVALGKL